jgi:hypothetical protein
MFHAVQSVPPTMANVLPTGDVLEIVRTVVGLDAVLVVDLRTVWRLSKKDPCHHTMDFGRFLASSRDT